MTIQGSILGKWEMGLLRFTKMLLFFQVFSYTTFSPVAGCPVGCSTRGQKCYKFFEKPLSRHDDEVTCQGEGGNLVSVHSKAENEFVGEAGEYWVCRIC